jgi:hypothetical protein
METSGMIFDLSTLTFVHTVLSLVALVAGTVVVTGLIGGCLDPPGSMLFLVTAAATSATGFAFPFHRFLPSHGVGIVALVALAAMVVARHVVHMSGGWRQVYVVGAVINLYLLVFVAIAQAFQKVPLLAHAAPTRSEPAFVVTQLVALGLFLMLGFAATRTGPGTGTR